MFLFSLNIHPAVELLNHMVVLLLGFWGTSDLFSITVAPIYVLINSVHGSPFSTFLPIFTIYSLFNGSHFERYEMISHCGLDLHFSDDQWRWSSFHVPVGHLCTFFGKMSVQIYTLFDQVFWVLVLSHMSCLYTLYITIHQSNQ